MGVEDEKVEFVAAGCQAGVELSAYDVARGRVVLEARDGIVRPA